jgi:thiamine-monophosphate kinase
MEIKNYGEDQLIEYIQQRFLTPPPLVGMGDDCAVIPNGNQALLVTTDSLVEGIHFIKSLISPENLGYKTLAVNISDIVAMGGIPNYAVLAMALPGNIDSDWFERFIQGVKSACNQFNIALLGGDTVGSKGDLFFNVTMIGSAAMDKIKYRNTAKPGDVVCVTGFLGDSSAGLQALIDNIEPSSFSIKCIQQHLHPQIDPQHGLWLGAHEGVHAMIDLSDGLDKDLKRILLSSKCGATIELSQIPISAALKETCLHQHWDPLKFALFGGEDYRLLLTISQNKLLQIQNGFRKAFDSELYVVGIINDSPMGHIRYFREGNPIQFEYSGYKHFDRESI